MKTYDATITREDGWWMVHVPAIDGLTQARRLSEAPKMAAELIALTLNVPIDSFTVNASIENVDDLPVAAMVADVADRRATAAKLESEASKKARELARALSARKIPIRDVGTLLGISPQRAHQLINA